MIELKDSSLSSGQPALIASKVLHKGEKRIKLIFPYDGDFLEKIKKIEGCKWSQTMRCWHVPDNNISHAGLRRSELLNLRMNSVDSKRGLLIIRGAKGKGFQKFKLAIKFVTWTGKRAEIPYFSYCQPLVASGHRDRALHF